MNKNFQYKISVIVPIYNTGAYLKETLESVINQTMAFEKNIQMILVNNASTDNSESICKEYKEKYPNNIKYVYLKKNQGPSGARNAGIPFVKGKYTNFLDSDDLWAADAFELAYEFLENHQEQIDCVSCRVKCFDAYDNWHVFDYEYTSDMIKDIKRDYTCVQFACAPLFIKSEILNTEKFDEKLVQCEDMEFVNRIIVPREYYGSLRSAIYYYRQRQLDNNSQMQIRVKDRRWYFETLMESFEGIISYSKNAYGRVIPYVQFLIMSHLQSRIKSRLPHDFSEEETKKYKSIIKYLIDLVDDIIIMQQRNITRDEKIFVLSLKHGYDYVANNLVLLNSGIYFNNLKIYSTDARDCILIQCLDFNNGVLKLFGRINLLLNKDNYRIYVKDDQENKYYLNLKPAPPNMNVVCLGETVVERHFFEIEIPIKNPIRLHFNFLFNNIEYEMNFGTGMFAKLNKYWFKYSYYFKDNYMITVDDSGSLFVENASFWKHVKKECIFLFQLLRQSKKKAFIGRFIYDLLKPFKRKNIWLVTDRPLSAGDSGEYFFRYLSTVKHNNVKAYFVLDKSSPDCSRLKKYGKILPYRSLKHKFYFLLSSKIISSLTNEWVYNLTGYIRDYVGDLIDFKFVHIQHGVIKDDISGSINKFNKSINQFVTSSYNEYKSLLDYPYGYTENEVILTGLPRFDALPLYNVAKTKKKILIAPTWRNGLTGKANYISDIYEYNPEFTKTQFYYSYQSLIEDSKLIELVKKYGYSIEFKLHPIIAAQAKDFRGNEFVTISTDTSPALDKVQDYSILITDYSSIAFDYAYMGTPIIYYQFDAEEFYSMHTYHKGYYDYVDNGFGPVISEKDALIDYILELMENGCKMEDKYTQRRQSFFEYIDHDNSKRVYEEITDN